MPFVIAILLLCCFMTSVHAKDFFDITYHTCYDGDTCRVTIPSMPEVVGQHILVQIADIDAPEIKGKCEQEERLAIHAQDRVRGLLKKAQRIDLRDAKRGTNFRLVAKVIADGQDISKLLVREGLAITHRRGKKKKDWCE